jgi:cellobiose-specific phosphotransferase system component IIC
VILRVYRRRQLLPPNSVQSQLDVFMGRFDHLPFLRALRTTFIVLLAGFMISCVVVVMANYAKVAREGSHQGW